MSATDRQLLLTHFAVNRIAKSHRSSDVEIAAGRLARELALPDGAVIALVSRGGTIIPPLSDLRVQANDHVTLVIHQGVRPMVDPVFRRGEASHEELPTRFEFPLRGSVLVGDLEDLYGVKMDAPPDRTLDELIRQRLGQLEAGAFGHQILFGQIALHVRKVSDNGQVERVGIFVLPPTDRPNA